MGCTGNQIQNIDLLNNDLTNARTMAIEETNVLSQIGGSVQFGKRQDLFWIAVSIIIAGTLVALSMFKKKKRR